MKKLIFLFGLLAVVLSASAQESATYDSKIDYASSWTSYAPTTVPNATTATDSVWYYTVLKESSKPLFYEIKLSLDSISGTKKVVTVILQTKTWASDSYTNVTTKTWTAGRDTVITFTNFATPTLSGSFAADSTMLFTSNSAVKMSRYYRIFVRSATKGFVIKVPELSMLFKEQ